MTHDHHETVVVERRGGGAGAILGIIVLVALLAGIWYFGFGPGRGAIGASNNGTDINVNVELPSVQPAAS